MQLKRERLKIKEKKESLGSRRAWDPRYRRHDYRETSGREDKRELAGRTGARQPREFCESFSFCVRLRQEMICYGGGVW